MKIFRLFLLVFLTYSSVPAYAQNTGGIFGPKVSKDHQSAQYRVASDNDLEQYAQRFHYQKSLSGDLMWRVVAQTRDTDERSSDFDFLQGELFWQLSDDDDTWAYGLRFDLRYRDDNRPALFGAHFTNQFKLGSRSSIRAIILSSKEFGNNPSEGISISSRGRFNYLLKARVNVGVEMFSSYGSTNDFNTLSEQSHTLGPYAVFNLSKSWMISSSVLFGLSDESADTNLRVFIGRSF